MVDKNVNKCVLCETNAGEYFRKSHTSDDFDIYKCSNCGLEYTQPIPTDAELKEFYHNYKDIRADSKVVAKNAVRNLELIYQYADINEKSLLLDFGCGNGEFVELYGNNCYGVELATNNKNVKIVDNIKKLNTRKFNCITLFGVLEHLNDVKKTMQEINTYLKKEGYLIITTVDAESLIPYYYKPPEHLTYWTAKSFEKLAHLLKLEIVYYKPYTMVQRGAIYLDRLLSRTPEKLRNVILEKAVDELPEYIEIPTNEIFVIMKKTL